MQSNPRIVVNLLVISVKILVNLLVKLTKLGHQRKRRKSLLALLIQRHRPLVAGPPQRHRPLVAGVSGVSNLASFGGRSAEIGEVDAESVIEPVGPLRRAHPVPDQWGSAA